MQLFYPDKMLTWVLQDVYIHRNDRNKKTIWVKMIPNGTFKYITAYNLNRSIYFHETAYSMFDY